MKRDALEDPEDLRDRLYDHQNMPNVLHALLKWTGYDHRRLVVQFVEMNKETQYYRKRVNIRSFNFVSKYKPERRNTTWRLQAVQFCPVIDVDIFKEGGDNPVLWDLYQRDVVTKTEIIQFVFQYLLDCLHQYIPMERIKYFADWGSGKGIHLWFTPVGDYVKIDGIPFNGVPLGVHMVNLIVDRGLWNVECVSPITKAFIKKVCRKISLKDAIGYFGDDIDPYYRTLIKQYAGDYVENMDRHIYSNFLIKRMDYENEGGYGQRSFEPDGVFGVMFGFLFPKIDALATSATKTISLPYEKNTKGYYRHHFFEPKDIPHGILDVDANDIAIVKAEELIERLCK